MDHRRANEIVSLPVMVNVTYNGLPIYIESVNDMRQTANIHYLNQPKNVQEVSLIDLIEH